MNKLTKQTFDPEAFTYVDLGLPSGRLWATENAPGFYQFDEAVETFGDYLPKGSAFVELIEESTCTWNREKDGLDIVGPNGSAIFLPADDGIWPDNRPGGNPDGNYWTRMSYSHCNARNVSINSGGVFPLNSYSRAFGFCVRPCREI